MSPLYTTKALGREWLPSPIKNARLDDIAAYGPRIRLWNKEHYYSPTNHSWTQRPNRWSRIHERIALLLLTVALIWYLSRSSLPNMAFGGSSEQRTELVKSVESEADKLLRAQNGSWSDFAYVMYAPDVDRLCSSVMLAEALQRVGAKADRVVLYPEHFGLLGPRSRQKLLLKHAQEEFGAKMQSFPEMGNQKDEGVGKVLAFNLTGYKRVISMVVEGTVLGSLDDMFLLPEATVVMLKPHTVEHATSGIVEKGREISVISPSTAGFEKLQQEIHDKKGTALDIGMILNQVYGSSTLVLPRRPYSLLSREMRNLEHGDWLGGEGKELWDPVAALAEARFVQFNDVELGKPWMVKDAAVWETVRPKCQTMVNGAEVRRDCGNQEVWEAVYRDFEARRLGVCGLGMVGRD